MKSNDLFLIASISKTITVTALLQLYDKGLFKLDDLINDYLPFKISNPNQIQDITFKMLLTHTSSIADGNALDSQYYYGKDSPIPLIEFLKDYFIPLGKYYNADQNFYNFKLGSQHEYSNIGNAPIGYLVEVISDQNSNIYCKEHIFKPLGMKNSFWRLDEIKQHIVVPYSYSRKVYKPIQHYTFTDYPNGGLRSTAKDLHLFLKTISNNGQLDSFELLKPETVEKMISPQIPNIDNEVGLHLFLMNQSHNLWGRDGGEEGASTIMAFNPGTKIGVIILSNQGDADLGNLLSEAYMYGLNK